MNSISPSIHQLSSDFCQVWLFTQWVKPQNRERDHGYWSKPLFVSPYPWIQEDIGLILDHPQEFAQFRERIRRTERDEIEVGLSEDGNREVLHYPDELTKIFSRPQLHAGENRSVLPNQITNPDLYRERIRQEIAQARRNELQSELRFREAVRIVWDDKNSQTRTFLKLEYNGRCQICNFTFSKRDGEPYFEGLYLVPYTRAEWIDHPGNALCLCATCAAKFQHGSVEAGNVLEQLQAFRTQREGGNEFQALHIRLCNEEVHIRFFEKHVLALQELLRVAATPIAAAMTPDA